MCILVPIWKRNWLTQHLLSYYHLFESDNIRYRVVVVGSEGDISRKVARGLDYVEAENHPLDKKYDEGFKFCQQFNPDAVVLVGSDDFITKNYFEWAMNSINFGYDMVAFLDFYLADIVSKKVWYWGGYDGKRDGQSIGAGRVFSKNILDKMNWMPFYLNGEYKHYHEDDERSETRVKKNDGKVLTLNMASIGARYWAVKTGFEMNPIDAFKTNLVEIMENTKILFNQDIGIPLM